MKWPTHEMETVEDWVSDRLSAGEASPWEWFALMKLQEAIKDVKNTQGGPVVPLRPNLQVVKHEGQIS